MLFFVVYAWAWVHSFIAGYFTPVRYSGWTGTCSRTGGWPRSRSCTGRRGMTCSSVSLFLATVNSIQCLSSTYIQGTEKVVLFVWRSSFNSYTTCDFFLSQSSLESRSEYPKHLLHNPLLKQNAKKKILLAISILFSAKYCSQLQPSISFLSCALLVMFYWFIIIFSSSVQI